ncbi:MAG: hypothetical protein IKJ84_01175 [Oscillospiraceae bacterium]|nr:hypothetical protein [Oscillospiraceae bacterium]
MTNHKQYLYSKGNDLRADGDHAQAKEFGKVKVGRNHLFWRNGLRRYAIGLDSVQRIYRRVEPVFGKLCCGGNSFIIEWLVLVLHSGEELVLHIGDDAVKQAEALMVFLKDAHPNIQYGKVYH